MPDPAPHTDTSAPVRPEHVAALVGPVLEPHGDAVGVFAPGSWSGGASLVVGERAHPVVRCVSPLAVRDALDQHDREADDAPPPVLLVPFRDDLGWDVLARLAKRRLLAMAPWDVVRDLFGARQVDPRLLSEAWMARVLMEQAPTGGYPPVAGGVLDSDTAWSHVLAQVLGVRVQRPDVAALLSASISPDFARGYTSLPDDARSAVQTHIGRIAGSLAAALMVGVETGHGARLLTLGLACDVLFPQQGRGGADLDRAAVRLEAYLGGQPLDATSGAEWAAAARQVVARLTPSDAARVFRDAEDLLRVVRADLHVGLSTVLPAGYDRRVERFGTALSAALDGRGSSSDAAASLARVEGHQRALADEESVRIDRLQMALRLLRYTEHPRGTPARTLDAAVQAYLSEGSYVDWARSLLVGGDADAGVAVALDTLSDRVRTAREQQNQTFGARLAEWNKAPGPVEGAVLIEDVLDQVVVPVAEHLPVFMLVLDGLDFASFRQLQAPLQDRGWNAWSVAPNGAAAALAVSPSITKLSRTSLLSGALANGVARDEARALAEHSRLVKRSEPGKRPVLFHKGALSDGPTAMLAAPVRLALADGGQRVVAVVLNVLDDALAKSDQQLPLWSVDRIRLLDALLEAARISGRALVVLSDHGHVLESDGSALPGDGQERWRNYAEPVADKEVVLSGPRIERVMGTAAVVVPWSERVRYVRKKAGYHGGATPQEMVVPAAVFVQSGVSLPDGAPHRSSPPVWWSTVADEASPARTTAKTTRVKTEKQQVSLFTTPVDAPMSWPERVVHSEVYAAQHAAAGRLAPDTGLVTRVLGALESTQGSASTARLVAALGIEDAALQDTLANIQRVLNVDGYPVLTADPSNETVRLDLELASKQFGVDTAP